MNAKTFFLVFCLTIAVLGIITSSASATTTCDNRAAPIFTSIAPVIGTTSGGTAVTITGTGFTGATAVTIGGITASNIVVVSDSQITATTPAGTAGIADVVITACGSVTGSGAFTYSAPTTPLTAIGAISGTQQVGSTLTAGSLTPSAATVIYQWQESTSSTGTYTPISGATSSTYTPVSGDATQYIEVVATGTGGYTGTATSPVAGPVAAAVTTTTATTTTATPTPTTTTALPTVTSVSPSSGTTLGGNVVTIMGSGFSESSTEGDVNQVMFGSTAAPSYTFVSDSEITAPAPAEAVGMVDITVITSGGTSSGTSARSTADEYTYTAATTTTPAVTEITPDYGPVSVATSITIIGTGFTGATGVTVGGTAATNVVVVSSTEITATTPASSTVGQVDVIVTTPSGPSASVTADKYNFATTATSIPVPIFSASPTSGLAPLEVTFTDESTGNPASWDWNFGDGNTSTLENPANTYANNGTYTVTLTEQNSLGTNITTETNYIIVGGSALAADFTATPTSGTVPLTVQFTDTSTGSPTTWLWDFGDGTTGSAQNPSHIYTSPGTYSISLIASNGAGSNTFSQPDTITVSSVTETYTPAPVAVDTFEIPAAKASDSNAAWLAQQNAMSAALAVTATPASSLPPVIPLIALVGVALVFRKKYQ